VYARHAHQLTGASPQVALVVEEKLQPKARVSIASWNLKEAGANICSDEQKLYKGLCPWVSLHDKLKPDSYSERTG
jgi:hypothetical protein